MSENINEKTFVGLAYNELSQEGFGLPSVRSLRAPDEKSLLDSPIVKAAAMKAKAYGLKKHYTNEVPVSEADKQLYIAAILKKQKLSATKGELAMIAKSIKFIKIDGTVVVQCKCLIAPSQRVLLGFISGAIGFTAAFAAFKAIGAIAGHAVSNGMLATLLTGGNTVAGNVAAGATVAVGGFTAGVGIAALGTMLTNMFTKQFIESNKRKQLSLYISWVAFKNIDGKVVLKRFCNAIIDPYMYVPGTEDLAVSDETDEVSMTDLVENETDPVENPSIPDIIDEAAITPTEDAHNEEASAGGIVTGDNEKTLETESTQTSTEAWIDNADFDEFDVEMKKEDSIESLFNFDQE